jgi:outer membrane lipoprotein-sorting protein
LKRRYLIAAFIATVASGAEPVPAEAVQQALAACAAMKERFVDTECSTSTTKTGDYRVMIKAGTPDAMRVVFMRSLDVADLICNAGHKVELVQQLKDADGTNTVRWAINPKECGITRLPG